MVLPGCQPSTRNPASNRSACRNGSPGGGLPGDKTPTRGILPACCALTASGHAAAPPSSVMNSRRFISKVTCCCAVSVLPMERVAHLDVAGVCCAAGFRPRECRLGVKPDNARHEHNLSGQPPIPDIGAPGLRENV